MKNKIYIILLFISASAFSQQRVTTSIDTTRNKIGAQFNLTLRTNVDTLSYVIFPSGTHFGPMEIIRSYVVDTIKKDNRYELVKRYGLAQFDSGKYTIPQLNVAINSQVFPTDEIVVEVTNVKVDTLQQKMYDIKPIIGAKTETALGIWKYILIGLLILGIGALIYWLIRKTQAKKAEKEIFKTPIERATALLQTLEKKELWQKGEVKTYYSELTDIARNYIEEAIHIPAMESTTSELIVALREASVRKKMPVSQEILQNLERVLMQADLVKFAKSKPLDFEIAEDRSKIEKTILTLDKSIPAESEDELIYQEMQREKLLRKQKTMRILTSAGVVFLLLAGTFTYFVATKGFDYVKDNVIGHPTKDLVEGEWVSSEYGNPGISIETPRVLTRMDAEKALGKDAMALLKEFQMFGYGSMVDNFYVVVSTNTYKSEVKIDLDRTVEAVVKILETQGATNILVKKEEFNTAQGVTGIKAYGTLTMIDKVKKESKKMYYEILLFGQQNGLQEVMIMHEETDPYAKQITERILKSVELKSVTE